MNEIERIKILIRHLAESHIYFVDINYNEHDELVYNYFFENGFSVNKMNKTAYGSYVLEFLGGEMELQTFKNSIETYTELLCFILENVKSAKNKRVIRQSFKKYDSIECMQDVNYFLKHIS